MEYIYKKYIIFLLLSQIICHIAYAYSTQYNLPECQACLDDKDNCFNDTLSNTLTIKGRGVEYIDLNIDDSANEEKDGKGTIVEISYIIVSTKGDSITVQLENGNKDQYIIESRDNRVDCSYRKSLKFYQQDERIAVYCNNLYYDCEVKFDITLLKPEKQRDDINMPQCSECIAPSIGQKDSSNTCFESIYLPVHSWYYLYYDGYENGMYLDFLVSSHKRDTMRIEIQNNNGLFYLVSTRRDKVKCSDPQISVPVRWQYPRIAVYCYNNYRGCMFSVYVRSVPMDKPGIMNKSNHEKMIGYTEVVNPQWSEWSEWSDCVEIHNGMGRRTRERKCLQNSIDFVHPENATQLSSKEMNQLLKSSDYPYCEGSSTEIQNCELDVNEQSWLNILILFVIISSMILSFYIERKPRSSIYTDSSRYEDIVKTNQLNGSNDQYKRTAQREMSFSENSPLLNAYFRRYD